MDDTLKTLRIVTLVFVVGVLGVLSPGLYADWSFLRAARTQQEVELVQKLKAAQTEIQRLQGLVNAQKPAEVK